MQIGFGAACLSGDLRELHQPLHGALEQLR
jgi:hypothetical protein